MISICRLSASFLASLPARLSRQRGIVQTMLISLPLMFAGHVAASEDTMGQAVELNLRAISPHAAEAELPAKSPHHLAAAPATANAVNVLSQKRAPAAAFRHRNPELSAQDLVVVAVNAAGAETSRTIIRDPRIVRAETAEPSGRVMPREFLYRNDVTFSVILADPNAIAVRLYKPRWTGKIFVLDLIGEANLPDHG